MSAWGGFWIGMGISSAGLWIGLAVEIAAKTLAKRSDR
jgi:hypothetical protein